MHHCAIHFVEDHCFALLPIFLLVLCDTGITNKAEGKEERVLSEQVDQENSMNVTMSKLIDGQVQNSHCLQNKQCFYLAPATNYFVVVVDPDAHVDGHKGNLEHDPSLLHSVLERVLVGIVVEVCISQWIRHVVDRFSERIILYIVSHFYSFFVVNCILF